MSYIFIIFKFQNFLTYLIYFISSEKMRDLVTMFGRHLITNPLFGINFTDFFENLYYFDTKSNTNYLFVIHRQGIVKYNLDERKVKEKYSQFISNEYMIRNKCCLDSNEMIIYLNIFSEKKIITFNIKSKIWNMNFLDYSKKKPRVCYVSGLSFIPNPVNEVRLELFYFKNIFSTFKLNKKGKLKILKSKIPRKSGYNPFSIDYHLYILRETLMRNSMINLDQILADLFKERNYEQLVNCHFAWDKIIFFIFDIKQKQYVVDCVDVADSRKIYFNTKKFGSISLDGTDALCFDQDNVLHLVKTTSMWSDEKSHLKISSQELMPKIVIEKNQKHDYRLVSHYCLYFAKRYKINVPQVIIGGISGWFSIFQKFK